MADFWIKCLLLQKASVNEESKVIIASLDPNLILSEWAKWTNDYQEDINNNFKCHNNINNKILFLLIKMLMIISC